MSDENRLGWPDLQRFIYRGILFACIGAAIGAAVADDWETGAIVGGGSGVALQLTGIGIGLYLQWVLSKNGGL